MRNETAIIPSFQIDREKWNKCIAGSCNSMVYATTDFLDHLADNWVGVVMNDYEAVMPVPWRKKWGVRYCYDVPFIQQLGVFPAETAYFNVMAKVLYDVVRYGDYAFNHANNVTGEKLYTNFVMSLEGDYRSKFSADVVQNIRRSQGFGHTYQPCGMDEAINTFAETYRTRAAMAQEPFNRLQKLCDILNDKGALVVRKAVSSNEKLLAAVLLVDDGKRLYNIINSTLPGGKDTEANYFLLSSVWQEFERTGRSFDFEGSDLPGVKGFYKKFGGVNEPYAKVHFNHLPWPMKILKK